MGPEHSWEMTGPGQAKIVEVGDEDDATCSLELGSAAAVGYGSERKREVKDHGFLGFWLKPECSRPVVRHQSPNPVLLPKWRDVL